MIEQDLILSRALVSLYQNITIADGLIFRGGTALNKLFLKPAARYSEDIDLVQKNPEPIGPVFSAIRDVLDPWLGKPKRKLTERSAKLIYRYAAVNDMIGKLKIEINTTEHLQFQPLVQHAYEVDTSWFTGQAVIPTYQMNELMATKLKALYQRRKGRDAFDLWYTLSHQLIEPMVVIDLFEKYCAHDSGRITRRMFEESLHLKKQHQDFRRDMNPIISPSLQWDFNQGIALVEEELIWRIDG